MSNIPLSLRLALVLVIFIGMSCCLYPKKVDSARAIETFSVLMSDSTLAFNDQVERQVMTQACVVQANSEYETLLNTTLAHFYNTQNLWDPTSAAQLTEQLGGTAHTLTYDDVTLRYTYFDRGSTTVLIMAPGFGFTKEYLLPLVASLKDVDIVCFDHRGHGSDESPTEVDLGQPKTWADRCKDYLSHSLFKVYASKIGLGTVEAQDVIALVNHVKAVHPHANVYGLGQCYSAFIFAKAAALHKQTGHERLFDRLILYGTLPSTDNLFARLSNAPKFVQKMIQRWNNVLSNLLPLDTWMNFVKSFGDSLVSRPREAVGTLGDYLNELTDIPCILIQGMTDEIIKLIEFKRIWQESHHPILYGIVTPNGHLEDHLKCKELFIHLLYHTLLPIEAFDEWIKKNIKKEPGDHKKGHPPVMVQPATRNQA